MSNRSFGRETKYQKARAEVELLANRLGPEEKLPSIRQLAAVTDASINTLTGVLKDLEEQNIIYRRQGAGIFVSPARPRSIWLICDSQFFSHGHSPFWDVLVRQVHVRASEKREHLSMHFTLPHEVQNAALHRALIEEIHAGRVHGILGVGLQREMAQWILGQGVPFTAFAGWAPYVVHLDYRAMIAAGVRVLTEQGCRRIGFWKASSAITDFNEAPPETCELTGFFTEAMVEQGLEPDFGLVKNNWHLTGVAHQESNAEQGYRTAREVFEGAGPHPDGIVIADDTMTQGALLAMAEMGVRPGPDLVIATHANKGTPIMAGGATGIIRIEFDPAQLVAQLLAMLETLMAGEIPATTIHRSDVNIELVPPRLVPTPQQQRLARAA